MLEFEGVHCHAYPVKLFTYPRYLKLTRLLSGLFSSEGATSEMFWTRLYICVFYVCVCVYYYIILKTYEQKEPIKVPRGPTKA